MLPLRRDVYASAGGDATCTAIALTAQAIGDSENTATATVISAVPHIVHPGRSSATCASLDVPALGKVTRYALTGAPIGSVEYTRAEASMKLTGESYKRHDGFVPAGQANGIASSLVDQSKTKTIVTLGVFDFANSESGAASFMVQPATAAGYADSALSALAHIQHPGASDAPALALGDAEPVRTTYGAAYQLIQVTANNPRARIKHAAEASGAATSDVETASAWQTSIVHSLVATATAQQDEWLIYGLQYWATASASAQAITAQAVPTLARMGYVDDALANAITLDITATRVMFANVDDALSNALVGLAFGVTNSEIKAPDSRYMVVPAEDRTMYVPAEDRTMRVQA